MDVMAKKPAPVQMTYLGYPNSTGLKTIDYRITDKYADPVDTKQFYSEKLIRMPRCFICFDIGSDLSAIPINPVQKSQIVFGVFNKFHKYNDESYKVWNRIIMSVPNSLLIIKKCVKNEEANKCFAKLNLPKDKYIVLDNVPNQITFYNNFNFIDICLDTFPYSGTTTSCDTLIMSTPIVTLNIPNRHVSNVTSSILFNMGMPELVAHSLDEYADIAINLAKSPEKIAYYKQNIRNKFLEVMNPQLFIKEFDNLIYTTYMNHNSTK
jgi:predicted O-linked N-acetylglucosamine transferase (SPINDLY family)